MTDVVFAVLCAIPLGTLVVAAVLFFRQPPWLPKEARREVAAFGRLLKYTDDVLTVMRTTPRSWQ